MPPPPGLTGALQHSQQSPKSHRAQCLDPLTRIRFGSGFRVWDALPPTGRRGCWDTGSSGQPEQSWHLRYRGPLARREATPACVKGQAVRGSWVTHGEEKSVGGWGVWGVGAARDPESRLGWRPNQKQPHMRSITHVRGAQIGAPFPARYRRDLSSLRPARPSLMAPGGWCLRALPAPDYSRTQAHEGMRWAPCVSGFCLSPRPTSSFFKVSCF